MNDKEAIGVNPLEKEINERNFGFEEESNQEDESDVESKEDNTKFRPIELKKR